MDDISDLPPHVLSEIGHFFDGYKDLEGRQELAARGREDRAAAEVALTDAQQRFAP